MKIVRLELEYGSDVVVATGGFDIPKINKTLDLELYDDVTPITVANYLNYVNNGLYDLTFVNRSITGFVLQAGGVTNISLPGEPFIPVGPDATFIEVPAFSSINNEPGISNTRATVAMAKVAAAFVEGGDCVVEGPGCTLIDGTGPDSATSEWFINLKDNSDPLDTDNGGFTVFGSIIDDGMETADQIAAFPNLNVPFVISDLPIADADPDPDPDAGPAADLTKSNLVMILSATEITRPIARFASTDIDFGNDTVADDISMDVFVTNTGNETLDFGEINNNALDAAFTVQSENCSNNSLAPVSVSPVATCTINLLFSPASLCKTDDRLIIDYTSQVSSDAFSVTYRAFSGFDDSDSDNVLSIVERAGPNNGDGNNDNIFDDIQSNVASLAICGGDYVTIVSDDAQGAKQLNLLSETALSSVKLLETIPDEAPLSSFDYASYQFNVDLPIDGLPGDSVRVAQYLPLGANPVAYYRYGPTPDDVNPHWYDFSFDELSQTGANFIGKVSITSESGDTIERNMVILNFVDGLRGDDDLIANSKIIHGVGGIQFKPHSSSGSAVYLWVLSILLVFRKFSKKYNK